MLEQRNETDNSDQIKDKKMQNSQEKWLKLFSKDVFTVAKKNGYKIEKNEFYEETLNGVDGRIVVSS